MPLTFNPYPMNENKSRSFEGGVELDNPYGQDGFGVRFDWGPQGALALGGGARMVAVVDVLSFTTALTVAVEQGIDVYPYRWKDETAAGFARQHDAVLAGGRSKRTGVSLSPASIRRHGEGVRRLVLPSPNGSAISHLLAAQGVTVIGVCLRNAGAAAEWASRHTGPDDVIAVIAAGERWKDDDTLRPALEDLWGAGAFIHHLGKRMSPEARAAAAAFGAYEGSLMECASGRELVRYGFPEDVEIAQELNASAVVPILDGERFRAAS